MASSERSTWKFPATFWIANLVEFFERAAYYAIFISITLYLTNVVGFNDIWSAWTKYPVKEYTNLGQGEYSLLIRTGIQGFAYTSGIFI